jgi:predicted CopG family antitoxin
MSSKSKMISVSEKTYHNLAELGSLEDSFDSVIARLIQKQKAASGQTLAGTGQTTAAPLQTNPTQAGGQNG